MIGVVVAGLLGLGGAAGGWLIGEPNLVAAGLAVAAGAAIQARASAQASGAGRTVAGACGAARTTRPGVEPTAGFATGERTERMGGDPPGCGRPTPRPARSPRP